MVADSSGQAQRFTAVLSEYQQAPEVTRQRMYLETLERVMQKADKIVIDGETAEGVVPYLPLNELNRNRADQGGQQ